MPNASVMVVEERRSSFGLAQLHQLRGRVGRGEHESYCLLIADPQNERSKRRIDALRKTDDGFAIAEMDLALRGPGEFTGLRQAGPFEFKPRRSFPGISICSKRRGRKPDALPSFVVSRRDQGEARDRSRG